MKLRGWIIGIVGAALMAVSVVGYLLFMRNYDRSQETLETLMPVRTLLSGERIEAAVLRKVTVPVAAHRPDAVRRPEELIGKYVVVPIGREEEIAAWKLSRDKLVPEEGERYYSFKTDAAANVNNMVRRGDRVDVWVELKQSAGEPGVERASALKVIEGLPVAGVKTAEGAEVTDKQGMDALLASDAAQLADSRGKSAGKPELNTFIMNDEVYAAYAAAAAAGTIRLALPNLTRETEAQALVTPEFSAWLERNAPSSAAYPLSQEANP
ncbi:RcpC/CpaB family pilus assembly protein [Gorillibacterium sp. sgz500922]|uniref:RcpC/CpaB family pilus assembly protein n=1 Tax=Gorillibacterium sp. sgz500922 TaxID=3446694 RepID=UPI003F6611AA